MLAVIAILTSGSSMIRWLHADRHWTQEQLKLGNCFVWLYFLSIITPMFFITWSLNYFIFAMLITGFSSQSVICRVVTAVWLVIYVISIGTILMETMWRKPRVEMCARLSQGTCCKTFNWLNEA
ncbi:hypothetical protein BD769DRAFT_1501804 [Suillus cothurnatus]|nr:hypothetical protein BD769DRAFT_1501804 [Suillus cothurnatus]